MSSSISPPASEQASVSSEAPEKSSAKHICRKCKASLPTGNALHQHIALCGKQQHGQQHCRCAAVEKELEEIKGLLADLLATKSKPDLDPSFKLFKESTKLGQEAPSEYVSRLQTVFSGLPVRLQYQQSTRWQLYENLRAAFPKFYAEERKLWDKIDLFELFDHIQTEFGEALEAEKWQAENGGGVRVMPKYGW